jgi:putative membrane protein
MRDSKALVISLATLLASLCLGLAQAQTDQSGGSGQSSGSGHDSLSSKDFVKRAAQSNLAEIKVSQLAESKAQSPEVKSFASRMVSDHTQANSELEQLAKAKNLKVPDDTDMMHKASMKMLQGKSGEAFDSAYMKQMDKDHKKVIDLFQSASNSSKVDPELRAFAAKMLPKLQDHHQIVAQVESKLPTTSASSKPSSANR